MFSLPIYWIGFYLFVFVFVIMEMLGNVFLGQMWTNAALENSTQAGVAQLNSGSNTTGDIKGAILQNQADAVNTAEKTWAIEQSVNPFVAKASATFSTDGTSVTGNATVPIDESPVNHFLNNLGGNQKANFGGSIQETVHSTLPSPPTSTLPTLGSSLPANTLPTLGSSLPPDPFGSSN